MVIKNQNHAKAKQKPVNAGKDTKKGTRHIVIEIVN